MTSVPLLGFAESEHVDGDLWDRAFELAYFIHRDRRVALRVVTSALAKLEVATARQDKRLYYTPVRRGARSRTKVVVNRPQLLQRLLLVESEPFERFKEASGSATRDDLLVHFVKDLVRVTLVRNGFYVTLGVSRLLHSYTTAETMNVYDALTDDHEHVHDDSYYRSRKGRILDELQERFGGLLAIVRGSRGEERFRSLPAMPRQRELVTAALSMFTPWATTCRLETGRGLETENEHARELQRCHSVLHPICFERLTDTAGVDSPDTRLEIPHFAYDADDESCGSFGRRATLSDDEREQIAREISGNVRLDLGSPTNPSLTLASYFHLP